MKKYFVIVIGLFSIASLAQVVPAVVAVTPSPSIMEILLKALDLLHSWKVVGVWAGVAALLKLLIDGTKALGLFDKIPEALQSSFVLLVGVLTVGLGVLADKGTVQMALVASVSSSAFAMFIHELADDILGWVKVKMEKKVSPPPTA